MNRRKFLLSSGSVIGSFATGSLGFSKIAVQPSLAATPNIGTPNNQQFPSSIQFTFEPFTIEGQSLPSGGTIEVIYRLVEDGSNTSVSPSPPTQSFNNLTSSATVGTTEQVLKVRAADVNFGVNHRLQVKFSVLDSGGTEQFATIEQSDTFLLEAPTGALSRYSMDDNDVQSGTLLDAWGSNDATINGATTGVNSPIKGSNNAISFDGNDDYIRAQNPVMPADFGKPFSVSFWFKGENSISGSNWFLSQQDNGGSNFNGWVINWKESGEELTLSTRDGTSKFLVATSVTPSELSSSWNHYVATYDGSGDVSGVNWYINGGQPQMISNTNDEGAGGAISQTDLYISSREGAERYLEGDLDDIRIYDFVLSQSEVQSIYDSTKP